MLLFILILVFLGEALLVFHITLEINKIERKVKELVSAIRKHYSFTRGS